MLKLFPLEAQPDGETWKNFSSIGIHAKIFLRWSEDL